MNKKLTIILGPTAVGKTDYSINLAKQIGSPIISCDSRQIYKELKIGTAPPSEKELALVKHYFIFSHSITQHYTAGKFEIEALELLENLFNKHDHIVACGGSGLYIDALCRGIDPFPSPDLSLRKTLSHRLEKEGIESLRYELKKIDIDSYNTIDIANPQRIIRALEVTLQTGKKFSEWKTAEHGSYLPNKKRDFEIEKIGLYRDREKLYERINNRVDIMMTSGLLGEVKSLDSYRYVDGILKSDLLHIPALRTVGYRELFDYLDSKHSLEKAVELIKRNTRHYAKRQMTWWGRDKEIKWIKLD